MQKSIMISRNFFFWLIYILVSSSPFVCAHKPLSSNQLKIISKKLNILKDSSLSYQNSDFNSSKINGVSIGGWLVLEPYITPSLFETAIAISKKNASTVHLNLNNTKVSLTIDDMHKNVSIVDEYTLCEKLGYENAKTILTSHYETWITKDDFKQIAESGFNLVRIPIGYWAWKLNNSLSTYPGNITYKDPYVGEALQLSYLEKAIDWATEYGLKVWVDLHGLPGSQNGFDNSGERILFGKLGWLTDTKNKALTIKIWNEMFKKHLNGSDTVVGIEIVNEPLAPKINLWDITQSYYEAFDIFKGIQPKDDNTTFVIHDAFQGIGHWNLELNPQYKNVSNQYYNLTGVSYSSQDVLVDHHHYEVFTDYQLLENQYERIMNIINYGQSINKELEYHPAVVGEWSGAITDCAKWLNGLGIGARYDGSYYKNGLFTTTDDMHGVCQSQKEISQWSKDYRISVRQFIEAQLATYESLTQGWIFWNWKTESAPEWDFLKLKEAGLFPSPFNNYTYFNSNGTIDQKFSSSLSKSAYQSSTSRSHSTTKAKNIGSSMKKNIFGNINTQPNNLHSGWKFGLAILLLTISTVLMFL